MQKTLKDWLKKTGLSATMLADMILVSRRYLRQILSGDKLPSLAVRYRLWLVIQEKSLSLHEVEMKSLKNEYKTNNLLERMSFMTQYFVDTWQKKGVLPKDEDRYSRKSKQMNLDEFLNQLCHKYSVKSDGNPVTECHMFLLKKIDSAEFDRYRSDNLQDISGLAELLQAILSGNAKKYLTNIEKYKINI